MGNDTKDIEPVEHEKCAKKNRISNRQYALHCCHCAKCALTTGTVVVNNEKQIKDHLDEDTTVCCPRDDGWHDKWTIEDGKPVRHKCTLMVEDSRPKMCDTQIYVEGDKVYCSDGNDPGAPYYRAGDMSHLFDTNQPSMSDPTIPQDRNYIYVWYDIEYGNKHIPISSYTSEQDIVWISACAIEKKASMVPKYPFLVSHPIACITANEITATLRAMNNVGQPLRSLLVKYNEGDPVIAKVYIEEVHEDRWMLPWSKFYVDAKYTESKPFNPNDRYHIGNPTEYKDLNDHEIEIRKFYRYRHKGFISKILGG